MLVERERKEEMEHMVETLRMFEFGSKAGKTLTTKKECMPREETW